MLNLIKFAYKNLLALFTWQNIERFLLEIRKEKDATYHIFY